MKHYKKTFSGAQTFKFFLFIGFIFPVLANATPTPDPKTPGLSKEERRLLSFKTPAIDCEAAKSQMLGNLNGLRTTTDQIKEKCLYSGTALANLSVTTKYCKGACECTYNAINNFAARLDAKMSEACSIVNSAKTVAANCGAGRDHCDALLAQKDIAASAALSEAKKIIEDAQAEIAAREKDDIAVAGIYRKVFLEIDQKLAAAKTPAEVTAVLSEYDTSKVFGAYAINAAQALKANDINWAPGFSGQYNANFISTFDDDPKTPANPEGLGKFSRELSQATITARQDVGLMKDLMPRVVTYQAAFDSRSAILNQTAVGLGSISNGIVNPSVVSSVAAANSAASALNSSSASRAPTPGLSGSSSAPSAGQLPGANTAASSATEKFHRALANATPEEAGAEIAPLASPETASKEWKKTAKETQETKVNELLNAFTPIGNSISDADPRAIKARGQAVAAAQSTSGGSLAKFTDSPEKTAHKGGKDRKTAEGEGITIAGGEHGAPMGGPNASEAESAFHPPGEVTSLRELLRRRLAERALGGGDADASLTVDALLATLKSGESRIADRANSNVAEETQASQAGPQAMDSEPLFRRVHNAHNRFQLRSFPRQAGI